MQIAAKLDEWGKGAWIAVMIAAFVVFWPAGLALLAYLIWSGRMGYRHCYWDGRTEDEFRQRRDEMRKEWRQHREEWKEMRRSWRQSMRDHWRSYQRSAESSGNAAFDEYKAETLKRLEEEQDEFSSFLDNLRKARDKAEFDQFMQSRRAAATKPEPAPEPSPEPEPAPERNDDNPAPYQA